MSAVCNGVVYTCRRVVGYRDVLSVVYRGVLSVVNHEVLSVIYRDVLSIVCVLVFDLSSTVEVFCVCGSGSSVGDLDRLVVLGMVACGVVLTVTRVMVGGLVEC